jgi:cellulase/cellobiase CelA1
MRNLALGFGLATLLMATAHADGYLWLSAAGASPASVYRYNLRTGQVDRTIAPTSWGFVTPSLSAWRTTVPYCA